MQWDVVVKRLEGHQAVVAFESGDEIVIPVKFLPPGCRVGDVLKIEIYFSPFGTLAHLLNNGTENA
ncbi:hypothetical protein JOD02_000944 [Caldicoprobacter guelmensis]|uniref:DUF3006 family protein n=1 Tax=Caldicoprobacter guelmensis TaxID=1170224 RepID=UPI0019595E1E|nr:hypothetical protein [Caldicoprobacter guelmensis]